ncbi:MAG TPA: TolC family protein, partial [Croceibacterium sp.]
MLLAAGLAGCTTPQLAQPEAGIAVPEGWQETEVAEGSVDLATYWRQLDDPLLTEFVEAAAARNLDLAQAAARLEQARAQLNGSRAQWMPQLSVNGRASQEF